MHVAVCVGLTNSAVCAGAFYGCFPTAGREGWRQIPASRTAARCERSPWVCAAAGSRNRGGTRASPRHGRCRGTRACRLHAERDRFAVTVDARRSLPRMLPPASGLRVPRLARGLLAGVFPRPVGRVGGKFLRAGRLCAANGALGLARRAGLGIAAEGGLAFAVRVAPERGLAVLARDAVGERRVAVPVRG